MKLKDMFLETSPLDTSPVHSKAREHTQGLEQVSDKRMYLVKQNLLQILDKLDFEDLSDPNIKMVIRQLLQQSIKFLN